MKSSDTRRITSMYLALCVIFAGILIGVANHSFVAIVVQATLGLLLLAVNWIIDTRTMNDDKKVRPQRLRSSTLQGPPASQFIARRENLLHDSVMTFKCVDCEWTLFWTFTGPVDLTDSTPVKVPDHVYERLKRHWKNHGSLRAMQWTRRLDPTSLAKN